MKKFFIRLVLLIIYLLAALINFTLLPISYDIWSCALAVTFAVTTVFLTGRASIFVPLPVFFITCIFPVSALSRLSRPLYGSWSESYSGILSMIAAESPLHGFELILPSLLATAAMFLALRRWARRNPSGA